VWGVSGDSQGQTVRRRCSCGIPGCRVGPIDTWADARQAVERILGYEERRAEREVERRQRQGEVLRRLTAAERERRETDPGLN
jgi:hypothetical protein